MSRPRNSINHATDQRAKHLPLYEPEYMDASAYDCPECGHPNPAHVCQERDRHECDAHDDRSDIR